MTALGTLSSVKMLVELTFSGGTENILIILNIGCLEQHEG